MNLGKAILIISLAILIQSCSWGRYPCPKPLEAQNSEKDGTGIMLIEVKRDKNGVIKRKEPKRIHRKKK